MISSSELAQNIVNDLDQNAYTTWHDPNKILRAINSACNFVLAYARRPRSLTLWEKNETTATDIFTFNHELFYPYRWELDWEKIKITNIPIVWLESEEDDSFYVNQNTLRTKTAGLKLNVLYHRWHEKITSLWNNDINMPDTMFQVLTHVALWFVYPGGMDVGSSLANQNYQMAQTLLGIYTKAYGFNLQPGQVEAAGIYTKT